MKFMLNVCVVGFGAIGPVHAKAAARSEYAACYAICDCLKERADKAAKLYGAKAYYNFEDVLADKNIDVIHICTPHYLHKEMAVSALKAGKNIVLEKPAAMTLSELSEMEEVYKMSDKKACIVLQNRMNTSVAEMKRLIKEDKSLGKMLGIAGFMTWRRDGEYYKRDSWRGRWATEGGALLINQAVHMIDLIDWLGGGIKSVKSSISNKSLDGIIETEDTSDSLFIFKSGVHGVFYATNAFGADSPFRIEAVFENATLRYADTRLYKIENGVKIIAEDFATDICGKKCWGGGHARVINDFYNALINGGEDYIDLKDGLHSAKVMLSMYKDKNPERKDWVNI